MMIYFYLPMHFDLGVRFWLCLVHKNVFPCCSTTKDVDPETRPTFVNQHFHSATLAVCSSQNSTYFILSIAVGFDFTCWWRREKGSQPGADSSDNEQKRSVRSSHQSVSSTQDRSITKHDPCASCQQCDWYYPQGTFKSYWMGFLCLHWMCKFNIFDRREQEKPSCGSFYRCRNTDLKKE